MRLFKLSGAMCVTFEFRNYCYEEAMVGSMKFGGGSAVMCRASPEEAKAQEQQNRVQS